MGKGLLGIELDDLDMDWNGENGLVVLWPNSFYIM